MSSIRAKILQRIRKRTPTKGSSQERILNRIRKRGKGAVFTSKDFLDLASRRATDQSLSRLARDGHIRRLARGLYHYPRTNVRLRIPVPPNPNAIADALGRQTGSRVVASGAWAANQLGLSTQVPAKPVYLTDGRPRKIRINSTSIQLRHAPPKDLPVGKPMSAMVFQALRHLGQAAVDDQVVRRLRAALSTSQRHQILRDAQYTTGWIADIVREVARKDSDSTPHG